jgi:hypothetical protein
MVSLLNGLDQLKTGKRSASSDLIILPDCLLKAEVT